MSHEVPVPEINARARNAQLAIGVDPGQCISLEELPGSSRTPLGVYSAGLGELRYRIPKVHAPKPEHGFTWREHDYALHVKRVGALHPRIAALVQLGAITCENKLAQGDRMAAESIAIRLDFALANQPFVWEQALRFLVANSGILGAKTDLRDKLVDDLVITQSTHFKQLSEVEPFFQPLDIGNYRV